ncbi:hypothetical protein LZZ90_04930 [Flavobacterium sp. SM15]|uniref:hypothetical protein n=1 Tax=Flavobacterium sp. SM15 TaxID=2908005 RepID=UPI001EDC7320|nr:hypothetical protein [Flavobacterium sp. SM15]MCG2610843.1 hypothetical protein [Flavobacterium sp. SM15]
MNLFRTFVFLLVLINCNSFAQNYRDKMIHQTIYPLLGNGIVQKTTKEDYEKAKAAILNLESDYGFEVDLKFRLIDCSYYHKDMAFFKEQLAILVEKHGFNFAYMKGSESYYDDLQKGELLAWFKPMYIRNHSIWLENNFEKQIDQRKLNEVELKNQIVNSFAMKIRDVSELDDKVKKDISDKLNEFFFANITDVYKVCRKLNTYPAGKTFGLIQNGFYGAFVRNFYSTDNIERTWLLFEPYLKDSYQKKDADYIHFKNYDVYNYSFKGYQKYGLITIDDIPEYLRSKNPEAKSVPVENAFFADKTKREMGW